MPGTSRLKLLMRIRARPPRVAAHLCVGIVLLSGVVVAQENPVRLEGVIGTELHWYPSRPLHPVSQSPQDDTANARIEVRADPRIAVKFNDLSASFGFMARKDFALAARDEFRIDDLWVEWKRKSFRLRIGNQVNRWTVMDIRQPAEVLVRRDWDDLWDPETLRQPMVRVVIAKPRWGLNLAWVPVFSPDRFRFGAPNRWDTTRPQPQLVDLGGAQPTGAIFEGLDEARIWVREDGSLVIRDRNRKGVLDGGYGARFTAHVGPADIGIHLYNGRDQLPTTMDVVVLSQQTNGNGDIVTANLEIVPVHARFTTGGASLAVTTGPVVWKAEGGAFLTADRQRTHCTIDDDYLLWAAGGEALLDNLIGTTDVQFRLEVSGDHQLPKAGDTVDNHTPDTEQSDCVFGIRDPRHVNRLVVAGNLVWKFGPVGLDLKAMVTYEGDWLAHLGAVVVPTEGLEIVVAGFLVGGGPEDWFGAYRKNDRLELSTRFRF